MCIFGGFPLRCHPEVVSSFCVFRISFNISVCKRFSPDIEWGSPRAFLEEQVLKLSDPGMG